MHLDRADTDRPEATEEHRDPEVLLAEAHRAVVDQMGHRLAERRVGDRRATPSPAATIDPTKFTVAAATWLAVFLVLVTPPGFLRPPAPAPYQPPAGLGESSLRYGLWLASHRVEEFLARDGRLPSSLGEAGVRDPALTVEVTGTNRYRLRGRLGTLALELGDDMSADSFMANSLERLRGE
jgi:hypothetical protein